MIKIKRFFIYLTLILVSFISIFPLYWMVSSATNKNSDIVQGRILPGIEFINNLKIHFLIQKIGEYKHHE